MHKSDIDKLEDILSNPKKYEGYLQLREIHLNHRNVKDIDKPKKGYEEAQDPKTIRSGGNVSTVEKSVMSRQSDVEYQLLYSIVHNTPKFVDSLTKLERIIYDYRYREKDIGIYEWEDIACELDKVVAKDDKSIGKTTTLRLRNRMLERLADRIGYPLM